MNIMVDLETLSTSMDAHILTVGAVAFNPQSGEIIDKFYHRVDFKSCEEIDLKKSEDTMFFWRSQPSAVYEEAFGSENRKPIKEVMNEFTKFWNKNNGKEFWCNGANFDEPILSTVFERLHLQKPWKFWNVRCLRTFMSLKNVTMKMFGEVKHNALDDCLNQIRAYMHVKKSLG